MIDLFHLLPDDWSLALRFSVEFSFLVSAWPCGTCLVCWLACQVFQKWWHAVLFALALFLVLSAAGIPILYFSQPEVLR